MSLIGEIFEEVEHFKYLGLQIGGEGGVEVAISFRVGEARWSADIVRKMWKNEGLAVEAKMMLYEGIVVPMAIHEAEMWSLREAERKKLDIFLDVVSEGYVWIDLVEQSRK